MYQLIKTPSLGAWCQSEGDRADPKIVLPSSVPALRLAAVGFVSLGFSTVESFANFYTFRSVTWNKM
jgi:hypothetical protein